MSALPVKLNKLKNLNVLIEIIISKEIISYGTCNNDDSETFCCVNDLLKNPLVVSNVKELNQLDVHQWNLKPYSFLKKGKARSCSTCLQPYVQPYSKTMI